MKISRREKRFLLFGGVALAGVLASVYLVEPLLSQQQQVREAIRQKMALLERYQLLAADHDRYHRRAEALRAAVGQAEGASFTGDKLPLVAAEIQGMLTRLGDEAGIAIARQNVPAPKRVDRFTQVIVELSVRGDRRALRDFLHKVQTAPRLLTIPRISIRAVPGRGDGALLAELQVAGYVAGGEDRPTQGPAPSSPRTARVARRDMP